MHKILLLLPNLIGGGAERLTVNLANDWVDRGYDVELILMQRRGELLPLLSPKIVIVDLGVDRIHKTINLLRKHFALSPPSVILAAMWPLTSATVFAWLLSGRKGRLFLSDHTVLSISRIHEHHVSLTYLRGLVGMTYRFATGIIAVSEGVKTDLCRLGRLRETKVKVIYNPTATSISPHREDLQVRNDLWGAGFKYHILSVGTLKVQKDHQTLIKAFARISPELNAKLTILGEGVLRPQLETLITELGLNGRVSMPGFATDPYPWFRSADLFVLSSQWEGFGNVIVEALECGVPVVSTDCQSGPAEILDNGRFGKLVPVNDVDGLAAAMMASLVETHDREKLMNRAKMFSVNTISNQYLDYLFGPQK